MLIPSLLLCSLLAGSNSQVVINEVSYDDSSTDDREFVEFYNPTSKDIDISGWVLEATDTATPDNNADYTIPANTTLKSGKFYVLGSAMVPNVDQVVGTTNLWENSQEALLLKDKDDNVIDTLVYKVNKGWIAAKIRLMEGDGIWGNAFSADGSETSMSRIRDGHDTDSNRDFVLRPSTPGKSNDLGKGAYIDFFDNRKVGSDLPDFGTSFVPPRVIDPTVIDSNNQNAIAASPQGKLAAIFWDPAGGGDAAMLLRDAGCNVRVEAWVYLDTKLEQSGEREMWSLGVQGTTGAFYNFPDPSGAAGYHANGNTGVCWTFEVTDANATLYLVDHNDGGRKAGTLYAPKTDRKVIGSKIDLKPIDTGWHRLRLEVNGSTVTGYFGGTYGSTTTGTKITGTLSAPAEGDVYIGYREFVNDNSTARPFTFDRMTVLSGSSAGTVANYGSVKATTKGTPRVGTNGSPVLGNASFQVTGGGLVAGPNPSLVLAGRATGTGIDLHTVLGGQKGSFGWVLPIYLILVGNADGNGDLALPIPIANDNALRNASLSFQILDFDASLKEFFKFGNSDGMTMIIGG